MHQRFHARLEHIVIGQAAGAEVLLGKVLRPGRGEELAQVCAGAHIVVENAVETDPLNAEGIVNEFELAGVVGTQGQKRVAAAHAKLPVFFVGDARRIRRNREFHHFLLTVQGCG